MNALIEKARAGDSRAVDDLIKLARRHAEKAVSFVLDDREDRKDASQEAVIKAITKLHTFDGRAKFSTWVGRIAENTAKDMYRRSCSRKREATVLLADLTATVDLGVPFNPAKTLVLKEALDSLSESMKEVMLPTAAGEDGGDIARRLSLPPGTVRTRIHRARKLLRAHLN